jgi:hypothetical protein
LCTCRDGTDELMTGLEKQEVPVLILSAGLGDLIKEILTYFKVEFSNTGFLRYTAEKYAIRPFCSILYC